MARELHERDGVRYEVEASECDGGYVAIWKCQQCHGVDGQTYSEYLRPEEAVAAAKALLFSVHHLRAHCGVPSMRR